MTGNPTNFWRRARIWLVYTGLGIGFGGVLIYRAYSQVDGSIFRYVGF